MDVMTASKLEAVLKHIRLYVLMQAPCLLWLNGQDTFDRAGALEQ
jgi:hypothetical protein